MGPAVFHRGVGDAVLELEHGMRHAQILQDRNHLTGQGCYSAGARAGKDHGLS